MNDYNSNQQKQQQAAGNRPKVHITPDGGPVAEVLRPFRAQQRAGETRAPLQPLEPQLQQQQQQPPQRERAKFVKSKSSPSSLTTHKFGLRPTPSPPRLIIDHQTGDIVESYPERPVYLRTYQPIEATDDELEHDANSGGGDDDDDEEEEDDTTQNQIDESLASHSSVQPQPQLQQQQARPGVASSNARLEGYLSLGARASHGQQQQQARAQQLHRQAPEMQPPLVIPPPHAGKTYFEPAGAAAGSALFDPRERAQASFRRALSSLANAECTDIAIVTEPEDREAARAGPHGPIRVTATSAAKGRALLAAQQKQQQQQQQQQQQHPGQSRHSSSANAANKLYGQPPPVSVTRDNRQQVYKPIEGPIRGPGAARKCPNAGGSGAGAAVSLQHQHQHHHQTASVNRAPSLEESSLYNFCFSLRVLLVLLLSGAIVYLLTGPLHQDCARYRPTLTHVSLITACVNLICVLVFSLLWYCNRVTRTLYQNLSASAFIVTFYSILVFVNLALAILFFFIDTCHFQKLLATRSALGGELSALPGGGGGTYDHDQFSANGLPEGPVELRNGDPAPHYDRQRLALEAVESIEHLLGNEATARAARHHSSGRRAAHSADDDGDGDGDGDSDDDAPGPSVPDEQLDQDASRQRRPPPPPAPSTTSAPSGADLLAEQYGQEHAHVPKVSPWEASWEYLGEQAVAARRAFRRFLATYDLKFIGALHALLAACFQYLAIKVAVVRSFFSAQARLGRYGSA